MKNLTSKSCALLCAFACLFLATKVYSQQTLTQINGWNAYVHLPAGYSSTTTSYPTIIFFPGIGEIGSNPGSLLSYGPSSYISQGWNGNVVVDGNTVEFIVISIQPPAGYPNEYYINEKIQTIKSLYRVNPNKLYLTGLSHGGWCATTYVTGDSYGGPYTYASQVAAVVEVQGVVPDDNQPYPNLFDNFANSGGRLLGFEQIYDNRMMPGRIARMNATKPNSGIYVQTNYGGGGHCCWNQYYGGLGVQPGNYLLDGVVQNIYQWLARQYRVTTAVNQAPVSNAGADQTITLPVSSVTLNGSGSDPDGSIASYLWSKISGPASGVITNSTSAQATLTGLTQGVYQYQLTVTDNSGGSASDLVQVTVNAAANIAPVANAGADQTITLPVDSVTLNGSGSDPDGSIVSSLWTKISGPASGSILNPAQAQANITGLTQGVYQFQLTVTDNGGTSASDLVQVTVNAAVNIAPVANAGADQTITLPVNSVTLNGSGTDADGSVVSYAWSRISGTGGTLLNPNASVTTIPGLLQGSHTFQLTVTDNAGATATDIVVITVQPLITPPSPTCNTGAPVTYLLSQTAPGEIYRPNGSAWKGGDTVKITGTSYTVIEFNNVGGDPCRPLVIMPATNLVTTVFRIKGNCRYIKLWGGSKNYGIKITGGSLAVTSSHHIEAENIECSGGSIGVYCKQDVEYANPATWSPNYRMTKLTFKKIWIHDINGEGMYVGHTEPNGVTVRSTYSGLDTVIVPIRLDSVEISNCIVERTNWDGIQLSNARNGNKIFGNTVRNYGLINMSSQQAGIILGSNSTGDIYNNTIVKGTGNGIEAFGYGVINILGNTLDSCGYDGRTNSNGTEGQQSIYTNDYVTSVEINPRQTINAFNNAVNHPKTSGAIFIAGYSNNSYPSAVYNNTFCIPGAPGNWQSTYLKLNVAGSVNLNNVLSCAGVANAAPSANAGPDMAITLPVTDVTLSGSGADTDGTIAAYQWTKLSGPAATLATPASATTVVSGLAEGVYKFELKVTDNGGAFAGDTVQVTVNATAIVLLPAVNPANTVNGLDYKYYEGSWTTMPSFSSLTATKTGTTLNFDLSPADRPDQYGFSFTGFITVPQDGLYNFYTTSDDGSVLFIDSVATVLNDGLHSALEKSGTIGLKAGKHAITGLFFEQVGQQIFNVSYEGPGIAKQLIPASALYRIALTNNPPIATAGANQTISTNTTTLTGGGSDPDGTVSQFIWLKIAGPDAVSFSNQLAPSTTVTRLVEGTYLFQLVVVDNAGAYSSAFTQVVVSRNTTTIDKNIRVNLFGGTNPFADSRWNNWNINAGTNSSNFLYEDRTASTVKASLSGSVLVVDNGAGYAASATIPPAAVLQYNSASTTQRNLTLSGLNPSKRYRLEFYASRANTGNRTVYTIGNRADTINTDSNINDYAAFSDIIPSNAGLVTVTLSRIGTWTYLAGFSIIEQGDVEIAGFAGNTPQPGMGETAKKILQGEDIVEMGANTVSVFPNPFSGAFKVQINDRATGDFILKLTSLTGQTVFYKKINKAAVTALETINVTNLVTGTYLLQVISVDTGSQTVHKVIKK